MPAISEFKEEREETSAHMWIRVLPNASQIAREFEDPADDPKNWEKAVREQSNPYKGRRFNESAQLSSKRETLHSESQKYLRAWRYFLKSFSYFWFPSLPQGSTAREKRLQEIRERIKARQLELEHLRRLSARFLYREDELKVFFNALAQQWREETGHLSSVSKKAMHPAYQRIIGLGLQAVPLILSELKEEPADWMWALNAITGEDPAGSEDNFDKAINAWLKWGQERGYIQ